jgi:ankyrin repeat protein
MLCGVWLQSWCRHQSKDREDGGTPLMIAAAQGHLAVVQYLGKLHGTDINNGCLQYGTTTLYIAAQNGRLDIVQCLVKEFRADVNQAAHNGCTALMMASHGKHDNVT